MTADEHRSHEARVEYALASKYLDDLIGDSLGYWLGQNIEAQLAIRRWKLARLQLDAAGIDPDTLARY